MGRKQKIIEPIKAPFELIFDFCIGKPDKNKGKKVIKRIKQNPKKDIEKNKKS